MTPGQWFLINPFDGENKCINGLTFMGLDRGLQEGVARGLDRGIATGLEWGKKV